MILTASQRAARAKVIRYVHLLGPQRCPLCGGSMLAEIGVDEVGWACLMCPHTKLWNVPDGDGFVHLRPSLACRVLNEEQVQGIYQRFAEDTKQIDIVREFHINRQAVVHLRLRWLALQADAIEAGA